MKILKGMPMMICFLIIDGLFANNIEQVNEYTQLLTEKIVHRDPVFGDYLIPKYFYTPPEYIGR